jgi:hypothetical protein
MTFRISIKWKYLQSIHHVAAGNNPSFKRYIVHQNLLQHGISQQMVLQTNKADDRTAGPNSLFWHRDEWEDGDAICKDSDHITILLVDLFMFVDSSNSSDSWGSALVWSTFVMLILQSWIYGSVAFLRQIWWLLSYFIDLMTGILEGKLGEIDLLWLSHFLKA